MVHLRKHSEILLELENGIKNSRRLEALCRDFEMQKVCYLPLNIFLLRPLHRLMHYKQIMERLCKHYPPNHGDFRDSRGKCINSSCSNSLNFKFWRKWLDCFLVEQESNQGNNEYFASFNRKKNICYRELKYACLFVFCICFIVSVEF